MRAKNWAGGAKRPRHGPALAQTAAALARFDGLRGQKPSTHHLPQSLVQLMGLLNDVAKYLALVWPLPFALVPINMHMAGGSACHRGSKTQSSGLLTLCLCILAVVF